MTEKSQPLLHARRRLPSGRAVLGGLLVTLSVLGILVATRLGDDTTYQYVVVARDDLAPGTVIQADDVAQIRLRLDESADWVVNDPAEIYGSVVLGPVGRLEFLQHANLAEGNTNAVPSGLAEVSIEVEPGRAPSSLAPGELISILATYDDGERAKTELVADRVVVLSFGNGSDDFSTTSTVLRLGVAEGDLASEIVTASLTGDLSIVGVTGASAVKLPATVGQ